MSGIVTWCLFSFDAILYWECEVSIKIERDVQKLPMYFLPWYVYDFSHHRHHRMALFFFNQKWCIFKKSKITHNHSLNHHNHSKSIVYRGVHSWSCPFSGLGQIYNLVSVIIESHRVVCLPWKSSLLCLLVRGKSPMPSSPFSSVQSLSHVDSLRPHGPQHARLPCPSPTPRACSNSCPSHQWRHPTISSSVVPFSSCPQSFPASACFPASPLCASGGQSICVC